MIGARIGDRAGARAGSAVGAGADPIGSDGGAVPTTTLTVAISDNADPVMSEAALAYSVVVTNTGAIDATSVSCVVTLDASLAFVSGSGTGWSVGAVGQVVTATRATLSVGAAPTITVNVTTGAATVTASTTSDASAANAPPATQDIETTSVLQVAKDAASGIRCPATLTQWQNVLTIAGDAVGAPSFLWLCQEASGNLADSIGGVALTPNAAPSYSNAVTGWTRVAVGTVDGTAAQRFSSTSASLPDLLTTSGALLAYVAFPTAAGGVRGVMGIGTVQGEMRYTGAVARIISGANTASGPSTVGTVVRPWINCFNQTIDDNTGYTDQDKITVTFGATVLGKQTQLGATAGAAAGPGRYLYAVEWSGAAAERTSTQWKTLLTTLAWTPTFTP